jgi:hypothetical protein
MREIFRRGEQLSRQKLNSIPYETLRAIHAGAGIRIFPAGDGGMTISAVSEKDKGMGTGGTNAGITKVAVLPAIPIEPTVVFWCSAATWAMYYPESEVVGTGNDQEWGAGPTSIVWAPMWVFTTLAGTPAAE